MKTNTYLGLSPRVIRAKIKAITEEAKKNDIRFFRYQFSDLAGNLREVTLTRENISGLGATSVDGSSVFGKMIPPTESDMMLMPDVSTYAVVPWHRHTARWFCNVFYPPVFDGAMMKPFEGCSRSMLYRTIKATEKLVGDYLKQTKPGLLYDKVQVYFAPELEFILVPESYDYKNIHRDSSLANKNYFVPLNEKVDLIMKDVLTYLEKMGFAKEKFHTEVSTFQCEIGLAYDHALKMADAAITTKYIIEHVAETYGWRASFIPKFKNKVNGNGMHVHQSLGVTTGDKQTNLFFDAKNLENNCLSSLGQWYIAGLLKHAREITALTNPTPISYKRLVPGAEAPTYVCWDWSNRTTLCRGHSPNTKKIRVEYRAPDPSCNPYLAFTAMLLAGSEGIAHRYELPPPDPRNLYTDNDNVERLPGDFGEALELMKASPLLAKKLGSIINELYKLGFHEWRNYSSKITDIDLERYF
jgi:glutamine synthetase